MTTDALGLALLGLHEGRALALLGRRRLLRGALRLLEALDINLALGLVVDDGPRVLLPNVTPAFVRSLFGAEPRRVLVSRRQLGQLGTKRSTYLPSASRTFKEDDPTLNGL